MKWCTINHGFPLITLKWPMCYTQWATKDFWNRSKRILLDPSFSNRLLLNEGNEVHICNKYAKFLLSFNPSDIRAVFVPVLEVPQDSPDESHWWCLALHMRAQQLWMIDSMYPHPFATHAKEIDLMLSGIDVLFRLCDPAWKACLLHSWSKCTVEILEPKDNSYCGVLMLACIKFFARRFTARFSVGTIPTARANMFLDDVQCEVNELKDCVGDVISGPRKTSRKL
ncbi:uncharacterized protein LOC110717801 [Chenopodium quinoa]|uniref:uncharacterized protein LOC110717801 n=1 Tax=Chenopodium quinoa TaxID=63459 RepID=UPI000B79113D|nr:uncharacterized protein LOC110717801 [Chenopodium quinoa]